jgi:transcriptional regulator with XRE-family HTH domain
MGRQTVELQGVSDPLDVEIGARLRQVRRSRGHSQVELADQLGVSFQQVQKYERGTNRVSGSMMVRACRFLQIEPKELFPPELSGGPAIDWSLFTNDEAVELLKAFSKIEAPEVRRAILQMARASTASLD